MKKHYKLYKSGKKWCCMLITTIALGIGVGQLDAWADSSTSQSEMINEQQIVNNEDSSTKNPNQTSESQNGRNNQTNENNTNSSVENGWVKTDSGQQAYYVDGKLSQGRDYVQLPTMNQQNGTSYYLMQDGIAQSGLQEWQGTYWYFNPTTYQLVKNSYVDPDGNNTGYLTNKDGAALNGIQKWQGTFYAFDYKTYRLVKNQKFSEWGNEYQIDNQGRVVSGLYMETNGDIYYYSPVTYLPERNTYIVPAGEQNGYLLGKDGKALSGVQKWQGTYYYFDSTTKQLVRNQYVQSQWGMWYMFGDNGKIVTGPHMMNGALYYFDPSSYLMVKDSYRVPAGSDRGYLLGKDGRALTGLQQWQGSLYYFDPSNYLLVKNQYIVMPGEQDGYLFGNDGMAQTGVQKWQGTYYYFDPTTKQLVRNQYVQSQWGLWYMFGDNGMIVTGPYKWQGSLYFFDPSSYLMVKNSYRVPAGSDRGYLLGADGRALTGVQKWQGTYYYFDPTTYQLVKNDYVQSQWGQWYMFGDDGMIVSGPYNWQGNLFYFDPSSYQVVKNKWINNIYFDDEGIGQDTYGNKLQSVWSSIINGQPGHIGIAIHSQFTGKTYSYTNAPGYRWLTASTVKVAVLSELLHRTNGNLDGNMNWLATQMIRYSDNNATTSICNNYLGGVQGMSNLYRALGMNSTGTTSTWGSTLTTPEDQLKLLDTIYLSNSTSYLNNNSKNYIKYQMHNVSAGQNWGISAGSSDFYIKNGWIPYGYMYINSIGFIPGGNWSGYTIAVYTDGQPGFQSAINVIERLARATKGVLQG